MRQGAAAAMPHPLPDAEQADTSLIAVTTAERAVRNHDSLAVERTERNHDSLVNSLTLYV